MTDPSKARGLVLSVKGVKATFPPGATDLDSSALVLSFTAEGESKRAPCLGVTLQGTSQKGGQWFLFDLKRGTSLSLHAQGNTLEASFLYAVPPTVTDVSMVYKDKVVVKSVPLKWR